jgi:hypothetical protein
VNGIVKRPSLFIYANNYVRRSCIVQATAVNFPSSTLNPDMPETIGIGAVSRKIAEVCRLRHRFRFCSIFSRNKCSLPLIWRKRQDACSNNYRVNKILCFFYFFTFFIKIICQVYFKNLLSRVYIGDVTHDYAHDITLYVLTLATLGNMPQT